MELNTLINALQAAEAAEKQGLPAAGLMDYARKPWGEMRLGPAAPTGWSKYKEASLTANTTTLYGCTGLFGLCGPDEVLGLSLTDDKLIEWMGWQSNSVCEQFIKFLTYVDVTGTAAGTPESTAMSGPCVDPIEAEKGTFEFFLGDKGLMGAAGQPIALTKVGERKCDKQPTYTLPFPGFPNGVRIDNDIDLEAIVSAEALKADLSRKLITGDKTTAGEFDGLEQLVNTGYVDVKTGALNAGIDSTIVAWANDNMDGAVNGLGNIIAMVIALVRRIKHRVALTGRGNISLGDMVLVMPTFLRDCFLDAFACYGLCVPSAFNELFRDNLAVREFRDKFNGGLFGDGYITVDGVPIPIITHDWLAIGQAGAGIFTSDIYLLTKRIGSTSVLYGQYHPMNEAVQVAAGFGADHYRTLQGGRLIQWSKWDNLCLQTALAIKPNVYLAAPWAQARITNVACTPLFAPISNNPQSAYFPSTKTVASPISQYFYSTDNFAWIQQDSGQL